MAIELTAPTTVLARLFRDYLGTDQISHDALLQGTESLNPHHSNHFSVLFTKQLYEISNFTLVTSLLASLLEKEQNLLC